MKTLKDLNKKVGIMGGTFNPLHIGHLIMAENAYELFGLEKILIMPTGNPPHKGAEVTDSKDHRIAMTELAIQGNERFELSLLEANMIGTTYTFKTLEILKKEYPFTDYYFILGADSLFNFDTWKHPKIICELCTILAAPRYNMITEDLEKQVNYIREKYRGTVCYLDTPNIDISSKEIRQRVLNGKSIKYYVPKEVERYILENNLYLTEDIGE